MQDHVGSHAMVIFWPDKLTKAVAESSSYKSCQAAHCLHSNKLLLMTTWDADMKQEQPDAIASKL